MARQSDFIPNSYQTPNAYIDKYLHLLTGEEWKVLSYAIRRILGFQKDGTESHSPSFQRASLAREESVWILDAA